MRTLSEKIYFGFKQDDRIDKLLLLKINRMFKYPGEFFKAKRFSGRK